MNNNKQSIIGFILISLVFLAYVLYNNYQMAKYEEQQMVEQTEQLAEAASQALEPVATEPTAEPTAEPTTETVDNTNGGIYYERGIRF